MSSYQHPDQVIRDKERTIKQTKQKLFKALVDSYHLEHRISTKTGILQHKSITSSQAKQHREDIRAARRDRKQAEVAIVNSIDEIKQLDREIKQLQARNTPPYNDHHID